MRRFLQWRTGDAILLAEANVSPAKDEAYFGDEADRMHMLFNFPVNQALFYGLASGDAKPLCRALEKTRLSQEMSQWAHFLRNHDELDLGRLTERQRERVYADMGPEPSMQLYDRGIRRRLAPMLAGDRRRLELAYSLMFTLPGTPVLRYGDEIGMGDDLALPEREAVRTAMQWSDDRHGGFTSAKRCKVPTIPDGPFAYRHVNVAQQRRDPESLLNWMERIIRARKECPELGWGTWEVVKTDAQGMLALRYDWRGCSVLLLHNLEGQPLTVRFKTGKDGDGRLSNLLSHAHSQADAQGRHRIDLEPYGYRWFRVGGLDYLSHRER
jgi:maltose alpha-D-glucosyltransferase/alpha-amylase